MKKTAIYTVCLFLMTLLLSGCQQEFLELKRNKSQAVPVREEDFGALMDNAGVLNLRAPLSLNTIGSDEYYLTQSAWSLLPEPTERNGYIWAPEVYEGQESQDWNQAYKRILYFNMVLEGLDSIEPDDRSPRWAQIRGNTLFQRAFNFHMLCEQFAEAFDPARSTEQLGIPLRLLSDINLKTPRATLAECFNQIEEDVLLAIALLPEQEVVPHRAIKAAGKALLARIYQQQRRWQEALQQAESCLSDRGDLLHYSTLDSNVRFPFPQHGLDNPEVLFANQASGIAILATVRFNIDPVLESFYETGDHRRSMYYQTLAGGNRVFRGSYGGGVANFCGLATDEVYLIAAECAARLGQEELAHERLSTLLRHRLDEDAFGRLNLGSGSALLETIFLERRKQLVCRGMRWHDLKRLQLEGLNEETLVRHIGTDRYSLPPGDSRYVWPIPDNAVVLGNVQQNPR